MHGRSFRPRWERRPCRGVHTLVGTAAQPERNGCRLLREKKVYFGIQYTQRLTKLIIYTAALILQRRIYTFRALLKDVFNQTFILGFT